ncbi:MAG: hypothetical protein H7A53_03035 [Akkermansiaceae bacterium]|nr:hypothetical protein [Akkermansiaceae bacterium]MCP5549859.1 hypothetical protein [Akkermansiaceae bacterium]
MHTLLTRLLLPVLFLPAAGLSLRAQELDLSLPILEASQTEEIKAKDGQKIIVHGSTERSGKSGSGTNFVNFKGAEFYLITFKSDLAPFAEGEPSDLYANKRIAVVGVVSLYQGKPQIKLTSPDQVKIIAEGEVFPPKKDAAAGEKPAEKPVEVAEAKSAPEAAPAAPKESAPVDWRRYFK